MEIIIRKFKLAEDRTRSPDIAERGVPLTYWFLEQAQQEEISSSPKVGKDEFCAHLTQTCWKWYLKGWQGKGKGIFARVTPRNYLKGGDQENLCKRRSRKHLKEEIKRFSSMPDLTSCQAVRSVFCWHWKASGAANFWQKSQSCANCKRAKTSSCQNKREMIKNDFHIWLSFLKRTYLSRWNELHGTIFMDRVESIKRVFLSLGLLDTH